MSSNEFYPGPRLLDVVRRRCLVTKGPHPHRRRILNLGTHAWVDGPFHIRRENPSGVVWLFTSADVIDRDTGEVLL